MSFQWLDGRSCLWRVRGLELSARKRFFQALEKPDEYFPRLGNNHTFDRPSTMQRYLWLGRAACPELVEGFSRPGIRITHPQNQFSVRRDAQTVTPAKITPSLEDGLGEGRLRRRGQPSGPTAIGGREKVPLRRKGSERGQERGQSA